MSTGLAASTVTPATTPPEESLATPTVLAAPIPCPAATAGTRRTASNAPTTARLGPFMLEPLLRSRIAHRSSLDPRGVPRARDRGDHTTAQRLHQHALDDGR